MAINTSAEKKYYEKVELKLNTVNKNDAFYQEILNSIKGGKNELYQKRMREAQVFDRKWIENIELYINSIDNITRNPRKYMVAQEDVVNIDRAKKINARSIQHLSSHTQFVQDIDKEGRVIPSKVLTTFYEDEIAIYENRFVMTLINKMAAFVEKRYDVVKNHMVCAQIDRLNFTSKFTWRNFAVECNVDIKVTEDVDDEINRLNKILMERLLVIRKYASGFMNSEFYKTVKSRALPIAPPILRTNIILKSVDYNNCLKLWTFLDSYRQIGFDVEIQEKNLDFDPNYINNIYDLVIMNYSAIVANQEERAQDYHLQKYKQRTIKAPKILEHLVNENISSGNEKIEEASANEYFYQRTRKAIVKDYQDMISSGKGYNASISKLYRQMQGISNSIYKDLFERIQEELGAKVERDEVRKARFEFLRRKKTVLNSIAWLKEADAKNTRAELVKINKQLDKMKKEEIAFQAKLKEDRKKALAKAREDRKKIVLTPEQLEAKRQERELRKQARLLAKQRKEEALRKKSLEAIAAQSAFISDNDGFIFEPEQKPENE